MWKDMRDNARVSESMIVISNNEGCRIAVAARSTRWRLYDRDCRAFDCNLSRLRIYFTRGSKEIRGESGERGMKHGLAE